MFKVWRCTLKGWSGRIKVFGHVRYCYYKSLMLPKAVQPKRQEQKQLKESRRTSCLCLRRYRDNSRSSSNTPPPPLRLWISSVDSCVSIVGLPAAQTHSLRHRGGSTVGMGRKTEPLICINPHDYLLRDPHPHHPNQPTADFIHTLQSMRRRALQSTSKSAPSTVTITTNSVCCFPWCSTAGMNCIYVWSLTAVEANRVTYVT